MSRPVAWISDESLRRLKWGGNESKGTVPVHALRSKVAKTPLYFKVGAPDDVTMALVNLVNAWDMTPGPRKIVRITRLIADARAALADADKAKP